MIFDKFYTNPKTLGRMRSYRMWITQVMIFFRRNSPPPKPLRRSRISLHHSESVRSNQSSADIIKCSSPISSSSENEARTVIAQVHTGKYSMTDDKPVIQYSQSSFRTKWDGSGRKYRWRISWNQWRNPTGKINATYKSDASKIVSNNSQATSITCLATKFSTAQHGTSYYTHKGEWYSGKTIRIRRFGSFKLK